jgi:hypothetical protein
MAVMPQNIRNPMHRRNKWASFLLAASSGIACVGLIEGCAQQSATTQPSSFTQRQDQALQNPFGYTPDMKQSDMSVSGHGAFDKEGFNRDKDFVLNP